MREIETPKISREHLTSDGKFKAAYVNVDSQLFKYTLLKQEE